MASILNNCAFDLTDIQKLYLGSLQFDGNIQISYPIEYDILTSSNIATLIVTDWEENWRSEGGHYYDIATIGGQRILLNEVLNWGKNVTLTEELTIDNRNHSYLKTITFNLSYIDYQFLKETKTSFLNNVDGQYVSPPIIAFLEDGNGNQICVGYDNPLFLKGLDSNVGEDNLMTFTMTSESGSRFRYYEIITCPTSHNFGGHVDVNICPSPTPSQTPTVTPSISVSITPTVTPSISISLTPTPTVTPSISVSPSESPIPSPTQTPTVTPSISVSPSRTPSVTPSLTPPNTPTPTSPGQSFGVAQGSPQSGWSPACAIGTPTGSYYSVPAYAAPTIGEYMYNESSLTTTVTWGNDSGTNWFFFKDGADEWAVRVSSTGWITDVVDCSNPPSPTPTPSISISVTPSRTPSVTPTLTPPVTPSTTPLRESYGLKETEYATSALACAEGTPDISVYLTIGNTIPSVGLYFYTTQGGSTGYAGDGSSWYMVYDATYGKYACVISGTGQITDVWDCSTPVSPTPSITISPTQTPTQTPSRTPSVTPSLTPDPTPSPAAVRKTFGIKETSYATSALACAQGTPDITIYLEVGYSVPTIGAYFYDNQVGGSGYSGNGNWYMVLDPPKYAAKISGSGYISDVFTC